MSNSIADLIDHFRIDNRLRTGTLFDPQFDCQKRNKVFPASIWDTAQMVFDFIERGSVIDIVVPDILQYF